MLSGKNVRVQCYTEVVFKSKAKDKQRPDGLIIVTRGSKTWSAIIEAKIGNNELDKDQIERYLDLARQHHIDAVITISNQFAPLPNHHPVKISRQKTRTVKLIHYSWLHILTRADLVASKKRVDDPGAKVYSAGARALLRSQGVRDYVSNPEWPSGWKKVCVNNPKQRDYPRGRRVGNRSDIELASVIEVPIALSFGPHWARLVEIDLSRARAKDPELNFKEDVSSLVGDKVLAAEFRIPNAAANLSIQADFRRRTVTYGMALGRAEGRESTDEAGQLVAPPAKGNRAGQDLRPVELATANSVRNGPTGRRDRGHTSPDPGQWFKDLPKTLEVIRVHDLMGKYSGAQTFVDLVGAGSQEFYRQIGQNLNKWVPKPPRVKTERKVKADQVPDGAKPSSPLHPAEHENRLTAFSWLKPNRNDEN